VQQPFERWSNAQEAFATGFLARQFAAAKVDCLIFEVDLIGVQARDIGLRLAKVRLEWNLVALAYNCRKIAPLRA